MSKKKKGRNKKRKGGPQWALKIRNGFGGGQRKKTEREKKPSNLQKDAEGGGARKSKAGMKSIALVQSGGWSSN